MVESMTDEIQQEMIKFKEAVEKTKYMIQQTQFVVSAGLLEREMIRFFEKEEVTEYINIPLETKFLNDLLVNTVSDCKEIIRQIGNVFLNLRNVNESLTQLVTGLEIIRLTGRTEVSKITTNKSVFESLIEDLAKFREVLKGSLAEIESSTLQLKNLTSDIETFCKI